MGIELNSATKSKEQGIRFWDERTFWHEMIYKSLIPTFGKPIILVCLLFIHAKHS